MNTTFSIILSIIITLVFTSCYTNRRVVNADQKSPHENMKLVIEKINPGDMINLVVNNKAYNYRKVTEIMDPTW